MMIRSTLSITAKVTRCANKQQRLAARREQFRGKSRMVSVRSRSRSPSLSSKAATVVSDHNSSKNHHRQRRNGHQLVASSYASSSAAYQHDYPPKGYPSDQGISEEEEERFAVMRLFLDSLQLATANITLSNNTTTISDNNIIVPEMTTANDNETSKSSARIKGDESIASISTNKEPKLNSDSVTKREQHAQLESTIGTKAKTTTKTKTTGSKKRLKPAMDFDRLKSSLRRSVYRKEKEKSMVLFQESQRNNQILPRTTVTDLFFLVSETDPVSAYSILQYYNSHSGGNSDTSTKSGEGIPDLDSSTNKRRSLYKRIANSVSLLNPKLHNTRQMHIVIDSLLNEIEEMDDDSKRVLYPKLVVSLVSQRIATIGPYAYKLYESMVDQYSSEIKAGWLNRLLSMSRYNRHNDVPYHDVMARLVQIPGGQLNPESVLPAIQNMFPFTNTEAVCVALRAWLEDFRNKQQVLFNEKTKTRESESQSDIEDRHREEPLVQLNPEDLIDLSTLESVSIGASQAGSSELIFLVWDVLEACHYAPTETIYENTVMAFANEKGSLRQAFAAMASMKEDGFEISRPLLRSVSSAIRLNRGLIGRARRMLIEDHHNEMDKLEHQRLLSQESINVVLSSYAERGDPRDAVEILELMAENNIEPNADSYSFVIEALGRDIKKRLKTNDQDYIQRNISIANTVLSMLDGKGITPNTHVIRNYVELLCMGDEIDTATSIVEDYLSSVDPEFRNTVNNITIYRVASEHAILGNYERAKALAEQMTEVVPALHRKIRSKEQRSLYVQNTMGVSESE